jgi:hypothetical protein
MNDSRLRLSTGSLRPFAHSAGVPAITLIAKNRVKAACRAICAFARDRAGQA